MEKKNWNKSWEVGQIVAADYSTARVFSDFGIDFCCHGDVCLENACRNAGVSVEEVLDALETSSSDYKVSNGFSTWPLDLLIDYVLKIHHRYIRRRGPEILALLEKVETVHGAVHPELHELNSLFVESLEDLEMHLQKEENVLFPYLLELFGAAEQKQFIGQMHCGTVANPIRVMRMEHEGEGNRYHRIAELTGQFTVPEDGCNSYRLLMHELEDFVGHLYEHIHLENNLIFSQAVRLEEKWVK